MEASEIRKLLEQFIGHRKNTMLAVVKEVDEQENTCLVVDDETEIPGVRIQPITGGEKGMICIPAIGSYVLCGRIEMDEDWMMIQASEYSKIVINGGDLGGLVKIEPLIDWMGKVYADMQTLKTQLNTWPVVGNSAPLALDWNVTATQPIRSNFENELIKQ